MRHTYPLPGNEDEFQDFCVRFYRHHLKRDTLVPYAKRGEKQDGIDIIDQVGVKPLIAIQCKNHEPHKTIPPQEIKDEVNRAESSSHPIGRYIIATTAKKSRNAQDTVLELNRRDEAQRQFDVEIHFREDICTYLCEFQEAVADFIVWGKRSDQKAPGPARLSAGGLSSAQSESDAEGTGLFAEIDGLFKERKLEAAEHDIKKLPDPEKDGTLGIAQRYGLLRLRAKLALEHAEFEESARLFHLAYDARPDLLQSRQNRVLAFALSGEREAHSLRPKSC